MAHKDTMTNDHEFTITDQGQTGEPVIRQEGEFQRERHESTTMTFGSGPTTAVSLSFESPTWDRPHVWKQEAESRK